MYLFRSIVHGQHRVRCSKTAPARGLGINVEWERTEGPCPHQARGINPEEGDLCNETSGAGDLASPPREFWRMHFALALLWSLAACRWCLLRPLLIGKQRKGDGAGEDVLQMYLDQMCFSLPLQLKQAGKHMSLRVGLSFFKRTATGVADLHL